MELTRRRKQVVLGTIAVLAACAVAIPFLPRLETIAAPYRGVARVELPKFTRVELPGSETAPVQTSTEAALPDETVSVALEEPTTEAPPAGASRSIPSARTTPGSVIPVKFDLESPGLGDEVVGGDEIIIRKAVRLGSREIGSLPIHVDSRSRLLVRPGDLKSVLAATGQGTRVSGANELRTFAELRKDGLDLRYDPNSDSVILTIS